MKAKELYPDARDTYCFRSPYDYTPIVDSFGEVLVRVDDKDYQGDTRILYKKENRYGFLNFGWGSCSGCDALQACTSYEDVEEIIANLERDIKWFDSLSEIVEYLNKDDDRALSYYYHKDEWKEFLRKVNQYYLDKHRKIVDNKNDIVERDSQLSFENFCKEIENFKSYYANMDDTNGAHLDHPVYTNRELLRRLIHKYNINMEFVNNVFFVKFSMSNLSCKDMINIFGILSNLSQTNCNIKEVNGNCVVSMLWTYTQI